MIQHYWEVMSASRQYWPILNLEEGRRQLQSCWQWRSVRSPKRATTYHPQCIFQVEQPSPSPNLRFIITARGLRPRHIFLVSVVLALNRIDIVARIAILVMLGSKTGRRTVARTPLGRHVPSPLRLHVPCLNLSVSNLMDIDYVSSFKVSVQRNSISGAS